MLNAWGREFFRRLRDWVEGRFVGGWSQSSMSGVVAGAVARKSC